MKKQLINKKYLIYIFVLIFIAILGISFAFYSSDDTFVNEFKSMTYDVKIEEEFNNVGTEGGVPFDGGKKPVAFINKILEISKGNKDHLIVLDFFAGSGSTGHCIIEGNKISKNNQVILVQLPELTYEIKKGRKVAKTSQRQLWMMTNWR